MNTPTVAYGGTTIALGYTVGGEAREIVRQETSRRTLGGYLRTSVTAWHYEYTLRCTALRTVYDSLVALRGTAEAAGAYPTFDFADLWPTANGVQVGVEIGSLEWDVPGVDTGSFDLTLREVNPR